MVHRAGTYAVKKAKKKRLDVVEVRMSRQMQESRSRNERISGMTTVGQISRKRLENRLK